MAINVALWMVTVSPSSAAIVLVSISRRSILADAGLTSFLVAAQSVGACRFVMNTQAAIRGGLITDVDTSRTGPTRGISNVAVTVEFARELHWDDFYTRTNSFDKSGVYEMGIELARVSSETRWP